MNTSSAIQVLSKVATNDETVRMVDEVIAYIKSFGLHTEVGPFETTRKLIATSQQPLGGGYFYARVDKKK